MIKKKITSAALLQTKGGVAIGKEETVKKTVPIGKLMHDFACTDPAEMYYETLADRVRFFKESKEGVTIMCKVLEDMRYESWQEGVREGKKEGKKEGAQSKAKEMSVVLAKMGMPIDKIAHAAETSVDVVQKWIHENACLVR